jgi:hypothetical protein
LDSQVAAGHGCALTAGTAIGKRELAFMNVQLKMTRWADLGFVMCGVLCVMCVVWCAMCDVMMMCDE